MRVVLVLMAILAGLCAAGNLLRGVELWVFGDGTEAPETLAFGVLGAVGFFWALGRLREG